MQHNQDLQHTIIKTIQDVLELKEYLETKEDPILTLDVETDGVQECTAKLMGFAICLEDHEAFYFPWRHNDEEKTPWWTNQEESQIKSYIASLCRTKKLINHNIIFDVLVLYYNWGLDFTDNIYSDTILQKHTLEEEQPFGLKEVAVKYLGEWANKAQKEMHDSIKAHGGSTTKDNMEMWKADTEILGKYCCWDVLLTRKLFDIFEPRIEAEGLSDLFYKDEIMPLYKEVTIPMKKRGFNVDVPYFEVLNNKISAEIAEIETNILRTLAPEISEFEVCTLNENYPIKTSGNFPKVYAKLISFSLPEKDGKITLARKGLEKILEPQLEDHREFLYWLRDGASINAEKAAEVQKYMHQLDNEGSTSVFNLNSNSHLKWLFFEHFNETPLSKTETGEPQVDDDFVDSIKGSHSWIPTFIDYKKLSKMKSTYIEGVLSRHVDGIIYSSFLQFGPPSGRYASRNPNLQNLPRLKEEDSGLSELVLSYVNAIKVGFIAPPGYLLVNADQSQLEPRAFAEACGDPLLQDVFIKGEDLYGAIACRIWALPCLANEVKKKFPEKRQAAKVIALAVVYGAEGGRISKLIGITWEEANKIIQDYLNAYPGLRDFMRRCDKEVCLTGQVKTKFGRIRHLPEAKRLYKEFGGQLLNKKWAKANGLEEISWKFKNMLNLAKNFPIQGVAAHVMNRVAIAINRAFRHAGIDGVIVAQVHDELTSIVRADQAEAAGRIVKDKMENTVKLSVPLKADPVIGKNWAEAK